MTVISDVPVLFVAVEKRFGVQDYQVVKIGSRLAVYNSMSVARKSLGRLKRRMGIESIRIIGFSPEGNYQDIWDDYEHTEIFGAE